MTKHVTHWIGGKPWDGEAGRHGDIYDPATGQVSGQVDFATPAEVDAAVAAAKDALRDWRRISLAKRASVLFEFRELVKANAKNLAQLITEEHGKVASDAAGEVARGLEVVEFACGIPHLLKGGFSENVSTGVDSYSIRQPVGVVAGITPFNFPAMVPMWMFPLAIACGNTFILKPSEQVPLTQELVFNLIHEHGGLPDGVINLVNGSRDVVDGIRTQAESAQLVVPGFEASCNSENDCVPVLGQILGLGVDANTLAAVGLPNATPAQISRTPVQRVADMISPSMKYPSTATRA